MKCSALACDYDGTLAHNGVLSEGMAAALDRFRSSGRGLFMVTGRELPDLQNVCQALDKFDWIVAENGALLYRPADKLTKLLCPPPSAELVRRLAEARVEPLSIGRAIIATRQPHETLVTQLIKELGFELHVILNKGAVMVLPRGVDKATGLRAAFAETGLDPKAVVAIGDAENDHAFLIMCGLGVAVANALPSLKEHADLVTIGAHGFGVIELIDQILPTDLAEIPGRVQATAS